MFFVTNGGFFGTLGGGYIFGGFLGQNGGFFGRHHILVDRNVNNIRLCGTTPLSFACLCVTVPQHLWGHMAKVTIPPPPRAD